MIIDDTEIDRFIAQRFLKKYFFAEEVIVQDSAESALDYLKKCEFNVAALPQFIFLDIRMPEMDGFGFLAEYEKLPSAIKSKCIIMMLSSSLSPDDHERVKNIRYVSGFISKPLDAEKLNEVVHPSNCAA